MGELKEAVIRLKADEGSTITTNEPIVDDYSAVRAVQDVLQQMPYEALMSINLDSQLRPINYSIAAIGDVRSSLAPVDNVMKSALLANASSFILIHNHPSGDVTPSNADCITTVRFAEAGKMMNIPLKDHIIISPYSEAYYSFQANYRQLIDLPENFINVDPKKQALNASVRETEKKYKSKKREPAKSQSEQRKEFKQKIAQQFIDLLNGKNGTDSLEWVQRWKNIPSSMRNGATDREYRGINQFFLSLIAMQKGYHDQRWYTFNQVSDIKGAHVNKGEHAAQVEYWMALKTDAEGKEKRYYRISEMHEYLKKHPELQEPDQNPFRLFARYSYVFNAEQCTGIPKEKDVEVVNSDVSQAELVSTISKNMNVPIRNGGNESAYSPVTNSINMPDPKMFISDYAYNATALHELGHASGAANKLNRDGITKFNGFGSERYAYEELVAEITSAMMSCHLAGKDEDADSFIKEHEKNHLAYVASWKESIQKNADYLLNAVKEAETATNFLELNGDLMSLDEYNDKQRKNQMVESGMENESKYFSRQWLNIAESTNTPDIAIETERTEEPEAKASGIEL